MILRIDRNPTFWRRIAEHPDVAPRVLKGVGVDTVDALVRGFGAVPLAAPHGGFIFLPAAEPGSYDLHTLFTPDGWGREAAQAARVAFRYMFGAGEMDVCQTLEQQDYYRSRPPKSHGWVATSDFAEGSIGSVRSWALTRDRWLASPVGKQESQCPSSPPCPP